MEGGGGFYDLTENSNKGYGTKVPFPFVKNNVCKYTNVIIERHLTINEKLMDCLKDGIILDSFLAFHVGLAC